MSGTGSIPVLITGLGGGGFGMETLKALRLSELPYFFIGADITRMSFGLPNADRSYVVPPAIDPGYLDAIMNVVRENNVRILLPGSEPELTAISSNREAFAAAGVTLGINAHPVIELCMNKFSLMEKLRGKGYAVPATFLISSPDDIEKVSIYPVVCKPHIGGGGSQNVFLMQDRKECGLIAQYLLGYLDSFIVQEYVGDPESEYTVGVLSDGDGAIVDSIAVRRFLGSAMSSRMRMPNRTGRQDLGDVLVVSSGISQGSIGRFPDVTGFCEGVAADIGSRGPINIQCRAYRGEIYIFEINPRFSGTTYFRALAGFNEPDLFIRKQCLGQDIHGRIGYREGVVLRGLSEQFIEAGYE